MEQYEVIVYDADNRLMRTLYVLADDPSNACEWGHDWANGFLVRHPGSKIGWRVTAFPVGPKPEPAESSAT